MSYPTTKGGQDLDAYCNVVDTMLQEIREEFDFDRDTIPSPTQREAFEFLCVLLAWAQSFTGTLRYDVSVTHDNCPEHDEHARAKIERCRKEIGNA